MRMQLFLLLGKQEKIVRKTAIMTIYHISKKKDFYCLKPSIVRGGAGRCSET